MVDSYINRADKVSKPHHKNPFFLRLPAFASAVALVTRPFPAKCAATVERRFWGQSSTTPTHKRTLRFAGKLETNDPPKLASGKSRLQHHLSQMSCCTLAWNHMILPSTRISPTKTLLKMFLFPRWVLLVSWMVLHRLETSKLQPSYSKGDFPTSAKSMIEHFLKPGTSSWKDPRTRN